MRVLRSELLDDSNWNQIKTVSDVDQLIERFGFFDCIIYSLYMWGECSVNDRLAISYDGERIDDQCVRVVFQRQVDNPRSIELIFVGLQSASVTGRGDLADGIIQHVEYSFSGKSFYLAFKADKYEQGNYFSIAAAECYWRELRF